MYELVNLYMIYVDRYQNWLLADEKRAKNHLFIVGCAQHIIHCLVVFMMISAVYILFVAMMVLYVFLLPFVCVTLKHSGKI